jgi:DNA-binding XRE family transcriptional regulator
MNKINKIKKLRESLLLTQQEFAKKIGVHHCTISFWEQGRSKPDFRNIRKIIDVFNIKKEDII